ncbi:MAG: phosphotransferase [Acidobacteriota bacterium]|nr:phosphotransferase [Acidobacteriota bacterium]
MSFRSINDKIISNFMNLIFTENAVQRLNNFLIKNNKKSAIEALTPDASTREYFRISWNDSSAIACIYPESFLSKEQTYLDVANLFQTSGLPVAEIYSFDGELGVIVQEDFGDIVLRDVLENSDQDARENLLDEAISLIAKIQAATPLAFELNSIASRLKFDEEKLFWELNFFKTHYFETLRKKKLPEKDDNALTDELGEIAKELEKHAAVLCHRDFHAANLMIDKENRLRIIDHQDARIGAASYDLVSLLMDRVLHTPDESWLSEKKRFFLTERENLGLDKIDFTDFDKEFRLQTIQRCLKAIGTFSFQSINRGKIHFIRYIYPMFQIVLQAAEELYRFPNLQRIIAENI